MGGIIEKSCCSDDHAGKVIEGVNVTAAQEEFDWKAAEQRKQEEQTRAEKAKAVEEEAPVKSAEEQRTNAGEEEAAVQAPAEDAPTTCEFMITLRKNEPSEPLGIGLRRASSVNILVIKKPAGRALDVWHTENPTKKVRDGDQIVEVNGVSGAAKDMVDEMKSSVELRIKIRRHIRIVATLVKQGALGLKVDPGTLLVAKITEGVIKTWNMEQQPKMEIIEGDRLIEIQGKRKDGDSLIEVSSTQRLLDELTKFSNNDELTLTFTRPGVE